MTIRALRKLLERAPIKTLTVDVFDTVLLRKVYPEELQFYLHGKCASKILREQAELDVSPFAFVSLRRYVRKPIASERRHQGFDGEARLEERFALLLDVFLTGRGRTMSDEERHDIVDALIAEELALEKQLLRPNMRLVSLLRNFKDRGVRVYFLSDMYLSRDHIRELFVHFGIADLFEGGVTSSDLGYCKGSGRMSERILHGGVIGSFDSRTHMHIGDNEHADLLCAKGCSCEAVILRSFHTRLYRPIVGACGRVLSRVLRWHSSRALRQGFYQKLRNHMESMGPDARILFRLGYEVFGPVLLHYLSYLRASSIFAKRPIYFLSGEAPVFVDLYCVLWGNDSNVPGVYALSSINRITTLRSFAYLAVTRTAVHDTGSILGLFWRGKEKNTVRDYLESIGIDGVEWRFPKMLLDRPERGEIVKILAHLCDSRSRNGDRLLEPLERACQVVKNELNATGFLLAPRSIVADVGWHGGIQVLLEENAALLGAFHDIRGIYLGTVLAGPFGIPRMSNVEGVVFNSLQEEEGATLFVPEIWEQVLLKGREGMLSYLIAGIEACFHFWKGIPCVSPDALFQAVVAARKRFFTSPSKDEVRIFGSLEHDVGSGLCKRRPLVDMRLRRSLVWRLFLMEPWTFARLNAAQYWQRGFLRWYGLHCFSWLGRCRPAFERERERERTTILRELYDGPVDFKPLNVPLAVSER